MSMHRRTKLLGACIGIPLALLFLLAGVLFSLQPAESFALSTFVPQYNDTTPQDTHYEHGEIPNRVHFVYILDDPHRDLHFSFSNLLAVYSTYYYWRPSEIYLHTNADDNVLSRARNGLTGTWTQKIFEVPGVVVNHVSDFRSTRTGKDIKLMEARSDFAKVMVTHDFGGIYMDFDVHALRDIKPLRQSGFRAIVGRQDVGKINSGTFMSVQGGKVMKAWMDDMHEVYDGSWEHHSVDSITRVSEWLVQEPMEVLIMDLAAFGTASWISRSRKWLFKVHGETKSNLQGIMQGDSLPEHKASNKDRWYHRMRQGHLESWSSWKSQVINARPEPDGFPDWQYDWSSAYLLHAFDSDDDNKKWGTVGPKQISPRYVLARQSNYARAVYPVALEMYRLGLIRIDDDSSG